MNFQYLLNFCHKSFKMFSKYLMFSIFILFKYCQINFYKLLTKVPVNSKEFRLEAVPFSKNLLNKELYKYFENSY